MKNKINDLRNHLFETIEMLKSKEIDVNTAQTISNIGQTIIDSAKVELHAMKIMKRQSSSFIDDNETEKFLPEETPAKEDLKRPAAEYSNHSPLKIASPGNDN